MDVFSRLGDQDNSAVYVGPNGEKILIPADNALAQEQKINVNLSYEAHDPVQFQKDQQAREEKREQDAEEEKRRNQIVPPLVRAKPEPEEPIDKAEAL